MWTDVQTIILSEISQSQAQKDKYLIVANFLGTERSRAVGTGKGEGRGSCPEGAEIHLVE